MPGTFLDFEETRVSERDSELLLPLSFHPSGVLWTINIHTCTCIHIHSHILCQFFPVKVQRRKLKHDREREGDVLDRESLSGKVTTGQKLGGMNQSEKRVF